MSFAVIQVRQYDDKDQGGYGGDDEKWFVSGYNLKVELTEFINGLDVECKRKREESRGDTHIHMFGLSNKERSCHQLRWRILKEDQI